MVPKLKVLPRKEERRHLLRITRKTERNKLQSRKQPSRPEYKIPTLEGVLGPDLKALLVPGPAVLEISESQSLGDNSFENFVW